MDNYEYLDELQDVAKENSPDYEEVSKKAIKGEVIIGIDTNRARNIYFRITDNLYIKIFHIFTTIISNPITICLFLVYAVIEKKWIYLMLYFLVVGILVVIENYIVRKTILKNSLKDNTLYNKLYSKGIIEIKYIE